MFDSEIDGMGVVIACTIEKDTKSQESPDSDRKEHLPLCGEGVLKKEKSQGKQDHWKEDFGKLTKGNIPRGKTSLETKE